MINPYEAYTCVLLYGLFRLSGIDHLQWERDLTLNQPKCVGSETEASCIMEAVLS